MKSLERAQRKEEFKEYMNRKNDNRFVIAASARGASFYRSAEWKKLRMTALKLYGNSCHACGRGPKNGAIIQVDHIQSRWCFPELAFKIENLQILCLDCNEGKGTRTIRFR